MIIELSEFNEVRIKSFMTVTDKDFLGALILVIFSGNTETSSHQEIHHSA